MTKSPIEAPQCTHDFPVADTGASGGDLYVGPVGYVEYVGYVVTSVMLVVFLCQRHRPISKMGMPGIKKPNQKNPITVNANPQAINEEVLTKGSPSLWCMV